MSLGGDIELDGVIIKSQNITIAEIVVGETTPESVVRAAQVLACLTNQKFSIIHQVRVFGIQPYFNFRSITDSEGVLYPEILKLIHQRSEANASLRVWIAKKLMPRRIRLNREIFASDNHYSEHIYQDRFYSQVNTMIDVLLELINRNDLTNYRYLSSQLSRIATDRQIQDLLSIQSQRIDGLPQLLAGITSA